MFEVHTRQAGRVARHESADLDEDDRWLVDPAFLIVHGDSPTEIIDGGKCRTDLVTRM